MSGVMSIFDEYSPSDKNAERSLAGDIKEFFFTKKFKSLKVFIQKFLQKKDLFGEGVENFE